MSTVVDSWDDFVHFILSFNEDVLAETVSDSILISANIPSHEIESVFISELHAALTRLFVVEVESNVLCLKILMLRNLANWVFGFLFLGWINFISL